MRLIPDGDVAGAISTAWPESGADILEEAASGTPVRRLLKTHHARIAAVVRPQAVLPAGGAPAPWSFISKR